MHQPFTVPAVLREPRTPPAMFMGLIDRMPCDWMISSDDRTAWLQARGAGVGASEAATLMGLNEYESEFSLYQKHTTEQSPQVDNDFLEWGRRLESPLLEAFAEKNPTLRVMRCGWLLRHRQHLHLLATPDGLVLDEQGALGVLELKTGGESQHDAWKTDAPPRCQAQLQHQMLVTGAAFGWCVALIAGQHYYCHRYTRNEHFQHVLAERVQDFVQRCILRQPPAMDDSESTSTTLAHIRASGAMIDLPMVALEWHAKALLAAEQERAFKEEKELYRRKLQAAIGTASYGLLPGEGNGAYSFIERERAAYSVPATRSRVLQHTKKIPKPRR
jgi:putative phage-type endonuclease